MRARRTTVGLGQAYLSGKNDDNQQTVREGNRGEGARLVRLAERGRSSKQTSQVQFRPSGPQGKGDYAEDDKQATS